MAASSEQDLPTTTKLADGTDASGARAHADGVGPHGHVADLLRIYYLQVLPVPAGVAGCAHEQGHRATGVRGLMIGIGIRH